MSLETSKLKCSSCGAYLFEEDDVVYCPICGAPHHRECYNSLGHCAFEDKHGTDEQYDKDAVSTDETNVGKFSDVISKKKCQMCGELYSADEFVCPNCKTPDMAKFGKMGVTFDYLGGVPADMDLGEGVTADEAKQFVMTNTHRFIPKFASFKLGKKASFNWLAFFFPSAWFLSRKMIKIGVFTGAVEVALSMLFTPFINAWNSIIPADVNSYAQLAKEILANADKVGKPAFITSVIAAILMIVFKIICSVFGDLWYRNHCISSIKKIKSESENVEEDFQRKGGVSILLFVIGVIAVENLPRFISLINF